MHGGLPVPLALAPLRQICCIVPDPEGASIVDNQRHGAAFFGTRATLGIAAGLYARVGMENVYPSCRNAADGGDDMSASALIVHSPQ